MEAQAGICSHQNAHALFLAFNRTSSFDPVATRAVLAEIPAYIKDFSQKHPEGDLTGVIAIGSQLWDALYPSQRPEGLTGFPARTKGILSAPATDFDLHLHLHGERHDLNFQLGREIVAKLGSGFEIIEDVHGWRYLDSRDLTGFVDGTENPQGEDRPVVALVAEGPFAGGSFLHVQRYLHHLAGWNQLPVEDQEAIFGRTKADDVEFAAEDKSPHAHTKRTSLKDEDGNAIEILRHSLPYGNMRSNGLYFVAYARSAEPFTKMLTSMIEGDDEGRQDHLMTYTNAITGAAFFAPSVTFLEANR